MQTACRVSFPDRFPHKTFFNSKLTSEFRRTVSMSKAFFQLKSISNFCLLVLPFSVMMIGGCAVEAAKVTDVEKSAAVKNTELQSSVKAPSKTTKGATIEITQDSPADTVRVFYK